MEKSSKFQLCKNQIKTLFIDENSRDSCKELKKDELAGRYFEKFHSRIPYFMFKFQSVEDFLCNAMMDIIELKRNSCGEEVYVLKATPVVEQPPAVSESESYKDALDSPRPKRAVPRSQQALYVVPNLRVTIPGSRSVEVMDENANITKVHATDSSVPAPYSGLRAPSRMSVQLSREPEYFGRYPVVPSRESYEGLKKFRSIEQNETNIEVIRGKLYKILKGKMNGMWARFLPLQYKVLYNQTLPVTIDQIVKDSPLFDTQQCTFSDGQNRLIVYPNTDVCNAVRNSRQKSFDESLISNTSSACSAELMDLSLDDIILFGSEPGPLKLPHNNEVMDVFVCYVCSVTDICIQIKDSAYAYNLKEMDSMLDDLRDNNLTDFSVGTVCYCYSEVGLNAGSTLYHNLRVRIIQHCSGDKVRVEFLDHGDKLKVFKSDLYVLPPELNRLPYQAIHCALSDCQQFYDDNETSALSNNQVNILGKILLGKSFVAYIDTMEPQLSVTLWSPGSQVSVNKVLREKFSKLRSRHSGEGDCY